MIDLGIEKAEQLSIGWRVYLRGDLADGLGRWHVRGKWRPWGSRGRREWTVLSLDHNNAIVEAQYMADDWSDAAAQVDPAHLVVGVWLGHATGRDDKLTHAALPWKLREQTQTEAATRSYRDWPKDWLL